MSSTSHPEVIPWQLLPGLCDQVRGDIFLPGVRVQNGSGPTGGYLQDP